VCVIVRFFLRVRVCVFEFVRTCVYVRERTFMCCLCFFVFVCVCERAIVYAHAYVDVNFCEHARTCGRIYLYAYVCVNMCGCVGVGVVVGVGVGVCVGVCMSVGSQKCGSSATC